MRLLDRLAGKKPTSTRNSFGPYSWPQAGVTFDGIGYGANELIPMTSPGGKTEAIDGNFGGYLHALRSSPPAFAAQMKRARFLSQAKFIWRNKATRHTFGTTGLSLLERPWQSGTTGELLSKMEWHEGLAGNAFVFRRQTPAGLHLKVLRPDWVTICIGSEEDEQDPADQLDAEVIGYLYTPGGVGKGSQSTALRPSDVAHWSPLPDPAASFRGMSWITPLVREIQGDIATAEHKLRFFENGAPQPLSARVLTSTGWSTMGEMAVGSRVIGSDGHPHRVTGVFPQGVQDIYRLHFTDGSSAECTLDHVWTVSNNYDRKRGTTRTMTLAELISDGFHYPSGPAKWAVPMVDPVEYDEQGSDLPIDPYLLGLLLGDGSFRSNGKGSGGVSLACAIGDADETEQTITPMLPSGVMVWRRDRCGWSEFYFRREIGGPRTNPLTAAVKALGLFDALGRDKFVPEMYLRASVKDRVAVLQGLIDSDGSVEPSGLRFCTTSRRLAAAVVELAGSLGGAATINPTKGRSTMVVNIRQLPEWVVPARLLRKSASYSPTSALRVRTIVGAERVGQAQAQCIRVDTLDHLYVTDDFVVTHNTPNLVVKGIPAANSDEFKRMVDLMEDQHSGLANAYKTLYLASGADATVVGANLKDVAFKDVQGAGETRIAAVGEVPASLLGIAEGMQGSSLNAGNYAEARRSFIDGWLTSTLQSAAACLGEIVQTPTDAELWFDTSDMPLVREDQKDAADIESSKASTIRQLVDGGFDPESVIDAVTTQDMSKLVHTGRLSVQLIPPGQGKGTE